MIPDKLIPLLYLTVVAIAGGVLNYVGAPPEITGMIVGAGLTRVKMPAPSDVSISTTKPGPESEL